MAVPGSSAPRTGGCLCGAVRYEVNGDIGPVVYCHCTMCRRQTGHFYATSKVARERVRVAGAGDLVWYDSSPTARRAFCRVCGSALFWEHVGGKSLEILAGSLDDSSGLKAARHINVADKGGYYEIADGLPQFPHASGE